MSFHIWQAKIQEGYCVCLSLEGFEDAHKLKRGVPVVSHFPNDAYFRMDPDFPKDIALPDNVRNSGGFTLVSEKLKNVVSSNETNGIEYLRVDIINHKGRLASDAYYVVNPTNVYNAINLDSSTVIWNSINPDVISSCEKLSLREESIPEDARLFRVKHLERRVVARSDLVEEIVRGGFVGTSFTAVEQFRGF